MELLISSLLDVEWFPFLLASVVWFLGLTPGRVGVGVILPATCKHSYRKAAAPFSQSLAVPRETNASSQFPLNTGLNTEKEFCSLVVCLEASDAT